MTDKKIYKVWRILLESPNEWIDIVHIAKTANLTIRQTFAICERMPSPPVFRRRDPIWNDAQVSIQGTPEEIEMIRIQVTSKYYGITDAMRDTVYDALSATEWRSVKDLLDLTGLTRNELVRTISILTGVENKSSGRLSVYRKGEIR